jgi:hypothetical protein
MAFKIKRFRSDLSRQKTKIIWLVLGFLLIVALIFITIRDLTSPAIGSVSQMPPASRSDLPITEASKGHYTGKYVSFAYPAGYKKITATRTGNYLEVFNLYSAAHGHNEINVGVVRQTLGDISGIAFRRDHPQIYNLERHTRDRYIFVSHQNGFERAAFISHGDLTATIVVISPSGEDLTADSTTVINSLSWK